MKLSDCIDNQVVAIGNNRAYAIGDIAYQVKRVSHGGTMTRFAKLIPVMYVNGKWKETQLGKTLIKNWFDEVTLLDTH